MMGMVLLRSVGFSFVMGLGLATMAAGQSLESMCPGDIDAKCLEMVADYMIAAQPDDLASHKLAMQYADLLITKAPDHTARLTETFSKDADWTSLRDAAHSFGREGKTAQAAKLIWAATEARANDPDPNTKVLDMLLMGEDAADIGDFDLARKVHAAAALQLTADTTRPMPFYDELRLTRLMAIYGWPTDAFPILDGIYPKLAQLPQDHWSLGFAQTNLLTVAILCGHTDLENKLDADLTAFLGRVDPNVQTVVQKSHVSALVEAGRTEDAKNMAASYSLDFDAAIAFSPTMFLQHENDYYPGISQDTLRRFNAATAAIKDPAVQAGFMEALARELISNKQYVGLDNMLDRVADPALRGDLVRELMIYHARERDDAKTAADLYFAERPQYQPSLSGSGTFLARYPLSLTAQGLLIAGDLRRGGELADEVLALWIADTSGMREVDTLLIGALTVANDQDRINDWYNASATPHEQMEIAVASLDAMADVGRFDGLQALRDDLDMYLDRFSDKARPAPKYWPKDLTFPTQRGEAESMLLELDFRIAMALANFDRLSEAEMALARLQDDPVKAWPTLLAIANAKARAGKKDQAEADKREILTMVMSGKIPTPQMPFVFREMHP